MTAGLPNGPCTSLSSFARFERIAPFVFSLGVLKAAQRLSARNGSFLCWLCEPVMQDNGRGRCNERRATWAGRSKDGFFCELARCRLQRYWPPHAVAEATMTAL